MAVLDGLAVSSHLSEALAASEGWLASGVARHLSALAEDRTDLFPRKLKALCEIAFLEHCVTHRPGRALGRALERVLGPLWSGGELLALWRFNLAHANLFLPLGAAAVAAFGGSAAVSADLRTLVELSLRHRKERLPFRSLDLLHGTFRLTGDEEFFVRLKRTAAGGCLGELRFVHDFDPSDDYALTHTVFYLTDFGRRPWPPDLAAADRIEGVLDMLSERAETEWNLDLLAEYLLARQMLGLAGGRAAREAELLAGSQHDDGYWPGPADLTEVLEEKGAMPDETIFFSHYHTTLVAREALLRVGESR